MRKHSQGSAMSNFDTIPLQQSSDDQDYKDQEISSDFQAQSNKQSRKINLLQANSEKKAVFQKKNANIGKILLSNKQFDENFANEIIFSNSKSNTSQDKKSNKSSLVSIFQNKRLVESHNNFTGKESLEKQSRQNSQQFQIEENSQNQYEKIQKKNEKERYIFDYNTKGQLIKQFDINNLSAENSIKTSLNQKLDSDNNFDFQKIKIERFQNPSSLKSQQKISLMQEKMQQIDLNESKIQEKFMTPKKSIRAADCKNSSTISSCSNIDQNQMKVKDQSDTSSNGFSDSQDSEKKNSTGNNSMQDDSDNDEAQIYNDEQQIEKIEMQKQLEIQTIKEYAIKNGLLSNHDSYQTQNQNNNQPQKEQQIVQQCIDREKLLKELYVPPPLEILFKKNFIKEPVRTGFNQGMIPLNIKYNYEAKRSAQGPYIINSKQIIQKRREQNDRLNSQSKSMNRETSITKLDQLQKSEQSGKQKISIDLSKKLPNTKNIQSASKDQVLSARDQLVSDEEQQQQKVHLIQQSYQNETSLRHLFYLEYKRNFPDGQTNPIVYSRFGKTTYNSDEKFDINNFNQLIRTCNLKKILRETEQDIQNKSKNKEKSQFQEAVQYPLSDYYTPRDLNDKTLVFESRFESGNLQLAHKVSDNEYNLIIQNDINSKGHTQWFYFRVNNAKKGLKVKFNMLNMIKNKSLYNDGMKVLMYSVKKQQQSQDQLESNNQAIEENKENFGWERGGDDLGYFQNHYKKDFNNNYQRCYFTFTFTHTFEYDSDTVYFAYSLPYTYTDLTEYLCDIQSRQLNFVTRNTLCRTIAGNKCEYLTITNRVPYEVDKKKEGVVLTARIHPGESISSFMMKGIIDFLVSNDPQASELRDKFVFKIIPMLNPDGVINGNYRCSLAGCDLNRRWKYPSEVLHPTVYHTKKLILKLASERHLALYCDIHAHSRRKNVFMYGNSFDDQPQHPRAFPFLMSKLAQPNFSYDYSRFNYCKSKEQTARIAIWRELGSKIPNIFTMEASFCGPKAVKYEPHRRNKKIPQSELNYHFTTDDFLKIGRNLCETILLYRQEKEETIMGIQNLEFQVEQYHIEKEARIEQENLIQQQAQITDQRKFNEIQNIKNKLSIAPAQSNILHTIIDNESKNNKVQKKETENQQQPIEKNNEKTQKQSNKKKKINKKQSFSEDTQTIKNENSEQPAEQKQIKKKINYNIRDNSDESDAQSDSQPSEDNLDSDQILKLIPKKFGKKKYISGVEDNEKQKKIPQKIKEKKPKTELMPCLQNKKKELEEQKKKEAEAAEKILQKKLRLSQSISRTQVFKRNGIYMRDIATNIQYKGDSQNLSLMEQDILKATGCSWNRIIFPGFKGYTNPLEKYDLFRKTTEKVERNFKFDQILHSEQNIQTQVSPLGMANKNYDQKIFDSGKQQFLERQSQANSIINENLYKNYYENLFQKNKEFLMGSQSLQLQNQKLDSEEKLQDQRNKIISQQQISKNLNVQNQDNSNNLQQKIQETKFFEARSLMGALGQNPSLQLSSQKKQVLRQNLFEYGIEKGHDQKQDQKFNQNKFDKSNDLMNEKSDLNKFENKLYNKEICSASKQTNNSEEFKTIKKIINGMIVTQKMQQNNQNYQSPKDSLKKNILRVNDLLDSAHSDILNNQLRSQQKSCSNNPPQKQFQETKSNFSQVGQQIVIQKQESQKGINFMNVNEDRIIQTQYQQKRHIDQLSKPQAFSTGKHELSYLNNSIQIQPFVCPQIVNSSTKSRTASTDKNKDDQKQESTTIKYQQMAKIQNIQRQSKVLNYL